MAFKPEGKVPDFDRIKTILNNARIQDSNNALYQTILMLIERVRKLQGDTNSELASINESISSITGGGTSGGGGGGGGGGGSAAPSDATYITEANESASLPNSRQLIAGSGITLDVTVPNELTISGSGVSYVPVSTGAEPLEIMSDGAGHVLLIGFIP